MLQKQQTFISYQIPKEPSFPLQASKSRIYNTISDKSNNEKSTPAPKPPQLLEFREPITNTKVILIGTMHYNPTSVNLVRETIQKLGDNNELGSVIVESCDVRWNTTMEILKTPRGRFLEPFLTSEMKVACDESFKYGRPCVLGDQRIDITGISLKQTLKETFVGIVSPFNGKWEEMYTSFNEAANIALSAGEGYLSATSILDPRLLIAAPVSFAKYPFSFLARNPISTSIFFTIIYLLTTLDTGSTAFIDASLQEQVSSLFVSALFAAIEIVVFGRLFIEVLLAERNVIIAKNILGQCKKYSQSNKNRIIKWIPFREFFKQKNISRSNTEDEETSYVPDLIPIEEALLNGSINSSKEKTIVAVVGMAHCNGILKLLKDELIS